MQTGAQYSVMIINGDATDNWLPQVLRSKTARKALEILLHGKLRHTAIWVQACAVLGLPGLCSYYSNLLSVILTYIVIGLAKAVGGKKGSHAMKVQICAILLSLPHKSLASC